MGEHVTEHEQADPAIIVPVRGEYLLDAVFRSEANCNSTGGSLEVVFRKEGSQVWNGAKGLKYMYVKSACVSSRITSPRNAERIARIQSPASLQNFGLAISI